MARSNLVAIAMLCAFGAESSASACNLVIESARYGWKRWGDVTGKLKERCEGRSSCSFDVENGWLGDPDPGEDKFLRIKVRTSVGGVGGDFEFKEYQKKRFLDCQWTVRNGQRGYYVVAGGS